MKMIRFSLTILITVVLASCKVSQNTSEMTVYNDSIVIQSGQMLRLNINKGKAFNHPTFVVWQEDLEGNFLRTVFITKSYATGIFGHANVGDSVWLNKPGRSIQPSALPYWTNKKGLINGKTLVPTPENPYLDAYSGATPTGDFELRTAVSMKDEEYRILLEVNQPWDWNNYWTNSKFGNNHAYKHSAQPSLIYAVTVNRTDSVFYLNPIGHGEPIGENGKLFTDLSTISTAKDIFSELKVTILNK